MMIVAWKFIPVYRMSLAEMVTRMHRHGVKHTDLAPRNIAIDRQGVIRIIDFGMAEIDHVCVSKDCEGLEMEE